MAVRNGYTHVEETEHTMFETAGDLTISVRNIMWMSDQNVQPAAFVSVFITYNTRKMYTMSGKK